MEHRANAAAWWLILLCAGAVMLPSSEEVALLAVYEALGGPDWSITWNTSTDPCGGVIRRPWHGVSCENVSNVSHVVGLSLESNNLRGAMPASFAI